MKSTFDHIFKDEFMFVDMLAYTGFMFGNTSVSVPTLVSKVLRIYLPRSSGTF